MHEKQRNDAEGGLTRNPALRHCYGGWHGKDVLVLDPIAPTARVGRSCCGAVDGQICESQIGK
jgi:hypothetical protein